MTMNTTDTEQKKTPVEPIDLARTLVNALEDRKAEDIVLLDLREHSIVTDFFIICSGTSDRQLSALADAAGDAGRKKHRLKSPRVEGHPEGGWVLVDYGTVIVHCFSAEQRGRYDLEDLWRDGKVLLRIQ
jgi:ribosome-associated protein